MGIADHHDPPWRRRCQCRTNFPLSRSSGTKLIYYSKRISLMTSTCWRCWKHVALLVEDVLSGWWAASCKTGTRGNEPSLCRQQTAALSRCIEDAIHAFWVCYLFSSYFDSKNFKASAESHVLWNSALNAISLPAFQPFRNLFITLHRV